MKAEQHAIVWNNVSYRLKKLALDAQKDAAYAEAAEMERLSIVAGVVAAAYCDIAPSIR